MQDSMQVVSNTGVISSVCGGDAALCQVTLTTCFLLAERLAYLHTPINMACQYDCLRLVTRAV